MRIRQAVPLAVLLLVPLSAAAQGRPWQARLRFVGVHPHDRSSLVPGTTAGLDVHSGRAAELSISYAFRHDWAFELAFERSDLDVDIASAGAATSFQAGRAKLATGTVTLQRHFLTLGRARPYVGLGANLTSFASFKPSEDLVAGNVGTISFDDSVSLSGQVGVDFDVTDRISINADVKYHDVACDAHLLLVDGSPWHTVRLDVDPWVLGIGVGFRF
jgi:outer membrane protein